MKLVLNSVDTSVNRDDVFVLTFGHFEELTPPKDRGFFMGTRLIES